MNYDSDKGTATLEPAPLPATAPAAAPSPAALWKKYRRAAKGGAVEDELVQQYLPLVKTVVGKMAMTLPNHVSAEDLYSAGMVGLLNAVRQFDPKINPVFESYARLRIRGAVLDELRRMDWVPRSVHMKARQVEQVLRKLEQKKGRIPNDEEMAAALEMTGPEYEKLLSEIQPAVFIHLDAAPKVDGEWRTGQNEIISDDTQEDPLDETSKRELVSLIVNRLEDLPEMQRKVLSLYYFEDLRLREIAEAFGVTESRICQIHTKAILSLRSWLDKTDRCPA